MPKLKTVQDRLADTRLADKAHSDAHKEVEATFTNVTNDIKGVLGRAIPKVNFVINLRIITTSVKLEIKLDCTKYNGGSGLPDFARWCFEIKPDGEISCYSASEATHDHRLPLTLDTINAISKILTKAYIL